MKLFQTSKSLLVFLKQYWSISVIDGLPFEELTKKKRVFKNQAKSSDFYIFKYTQRQFFKILQFFCTT